MQGMKDAHRIIQAFPLFSIVSDLIKQFSRTYCGEQVPG